MPPSLLQPVKVVLVAFGFKLGAPDYIDFIFDVRSVPNPWKLNDFKVMRAGEIWGGLLRVLSFNVLWRRDVIRLQVLDGTHTRLQEGLMQVPLRLRK